MSDENVFSHIWSIENYSQFTCKHGDCIDSPIFAVCGLNGSQFCLQFYPEGVNSFQKHVVCYLKMIKNGYNNEVLKISATIVLRKSKGQFLSSLSDVNEFQEGVKKCYFLMKSKALRNEVESFEDDALEIRCEIKSPELRRGLSSSIRSTTNLVCNKVTFPWKLNFLHKIQSENISIPGLKSFKITLLLPNNNDYVSINIESKLTHVRYHTVTCKVILIDVDGTEKDSKIDTHVFYSNKDRRTWMFPNFITKDKLQKKNCMKNNAFTLIFKFIVPSRIISEKSDGIVAYKIEPLANHDQYTNVLMNSTDETSILQNDLDSMWKDEIHADVTLNVSGETFLTHKCVLSARSPVFKAMFLTTMLENQTNIVNIDDLEADILKALLKFLYTEKLDALDCQTAIKLLKAADKYQVQSLVERCAQIIIPIISEENMCEILTTADMVRHQPLKVAALECVEKNAANFFSSAEWLNWARGHIELASEVFQRLALKIPNINKT